MKIISALVLAAALFACSGCATVTGLVTGPFTGAVDLPRECYRQHTQAFEQNPMLYGLDALVVGPCGIVVGPVSGFVKGAALDVEWVCGKVSYGEVFGTCREGSIWRPCTVEWPSAPMRMPEPMPMK